MYFHIELDRIFYGSLLYFYLSLFNGILCLFQLNCIYPNTIQLWHHILHKLCCFFRCCIAWLNSAHSIYFPLFSSSILSSSSNIIFDISSYNSTKFSFHLLIFCSSSNSTYSIIIFVYENVYIVFFFLKNVFFNFWVCHITLFFFKELFRCFSLFI